MQRATRQRSAILAALEDSGWAMSPTEILECAQRQVPAVNLSTVYRQLVELHATGRIVKVTLPGSAARYEAVCASLEGGGGLSPAGNDATGSASGQEAHSGHVRHHHHHFHCSRCDRVFPLHACPGPMQGLAPPGFVVAAHEVTLYGRCADCAASGAAP